MTHDIPSPSLTINQLTAELRARTDGCPAFIECGTWSLNDWAVAATGELGEACNLLKKVRRGDDHLRAFRAELGDELSDAVIYLLQLMDRAGIDPEYALRRKYDAVSNRHRWPELDV